MNNQKILVGFLLKVKAANSRVQSDTSIIAKQALVWCPAPFILCTSLVYLVLYPASFLMQQAQHSFYMYPPPPAPPSHYSLNKSTS